MTPQRFLLDVTYTRTQRGAVGITRTVARLAEELRVVPGAAPFATVTFDGEGFRLADAPTAAHEPRASRLLRFATGAAKPAIETLLQLPWPLVRPLWAAAANGVFRNAAAGLPPVQPGPGDVFLLFDAGWNYPVWHAARHVRARGAAVVPLVHDLMPLQAPQFCVPWVRSAFGEWLRQICGTSDAMLCNSLATEQELRRHAKREGWALPPVGHFRLGCDPARQPVGDVRGPLREFMAAPGACYATVGSIEPKKNHALLLAAFESLWATKESLRLLVVGRRTPECASLLDSMARQAAVGRPLMLVHDASDAELAFVYRHASALVLPSLFEGFGLPLVEARALGCPVLASDIPAFRELSDAGVHLFDPAEPGPLAALLSRHVAGGLSLARTPMPPFSWNDSARQCIERVQRLLPAAASKPVPCREVAA